MPKPPTDDKLRRLTEKLEARKARRGQADEPSIVIAPDGVPPHEHALALFAAGRTAPMLCVPRTPTTPEEVAEWARQTRQMHVEAGL